MSIKVMNYVWEHSKRKGTELLALLALADFADDNGDCYPGVPRLARKTRTGQRNMQKLLKKLHAAGEITIHELEGIETGHGKTNRYTVHSSWNPCQRDNGVNPSSPVSYSSPQGVNARSPQGVSHSSPKPSVEPSVEPSAVRAVPSDVQSWYEALIPSVIDMGQSNTDTQLKRLVRRYGVNRLRMGLMTLKGTLERQTVDNPTAYLVGILRSLKEDGETGNHQPLPSFENGARAAQVESMQVYTAKDGNQYWGVFAQIQREKDGQNGS